MRPGHARRATTTVLGAAFLLALVGEAFATHPCPHHHGTVAVAADAVVHADHGSEAGSDHGSHGPCTCVGRCHAGSAPPLPTPILLGAVPVPEAPPASAPRPDRSDRTTIALFSLPWTHAPPSL